MQPVRLLLAVSLCATAAAAGAQARSDCPLRPQTLAAMRGCYRPLVVFSRSTGDARLKQQQSALDAAADDMMDRFVLMVPVLENASGYVPPLDAPYIVLPKAEQEAIRHRLGARAGDFQSVLLGEDGSAKLRSSRPLTVDRLNALIDAMPTRRMEMARPHAN